MNDNLRLGIIGCGSIADYAHIPNCFNVHGFEVTCFCDIKKEQLDTMCEKYNVKKGYLTHNEMFQKEELDAVLISASADSHYQILIDSMKANLHILVEKPLTADYEQAQSVYEIGKNYNKVILVGYQLRFLPNHILAKQYMVPEYIGNLLYVHIRAETLVIKPEETLLIDYTTHLIDLLRFYVGDRNLENLCSMQYGPKKHGNIYEGATILFRFEDGLTANIETIWVPEFSWGGVNRTIEIVGESGKIQTDMTGPSITIYNEKSLRNKILGNKTIYPKSMMLPSVPITDQAYLELLKDFKECIINNKKPAISLHDGFMAILIAESAKVSFEEKRFISFDQSKSDL